MEIITAYPTWYLLSCLVAGLAFAAAMYFRSGFYALNPLITWLLALLRTAAVALLVFLLFNPFIKISQRTVEKPIVVVIADNSASVLLNKDSVYYKKTFQAQLLNLKKELNAKADVKYLSFGAAVNDSFYLNFRDRTTNFEQVFNHIKEQYANRNLSAIVFASDGIFNIGESPIYSLNGISTPVYTIALGDTTAQNDLTIKQIRCNDVVYKDNQFGVEIDVLAKGMAGKTSVIELQKIDEKGNAQAISQKNIGFATNVQSTTQQFLLQANAVGMQHYKLKIKAVSGEISTQNNAKDFFVEVLSQKQKVLLLANAPHPDLSVLKQTLESSQNTDVKIAFATNFTENVADYTAIFLHNLPSQTQPIGGIIETIKKLKKPTCYILGKQTNLSQFGQVQNLLKITATTTAFNQAQGYLSNNFSLFVLDPNTLARLEQFPPLDVPFGSYQPSIANIDLLRQKIGAVRSEQPLITFANGLDSRQAIIAGEGLWKWYLAEFEQYKNHEAVNELLLKINQYLQTKDDKKPFVVKINKKIFNETEEPNFIAELYNQSYEPINTPETNLNVLNSKGKSYRFVFARAEKNYNLNIGNLPPDNYTYIASTKFEGRQYEAKGIFSIIALNLEAQNTTADHGLLFQLATKTNGKMIYPSQISSLAKIITAPSDFKPIIYNQNTIEELINWRYLMGIVAFLLGVEWVIRKLLGRY